MVRLFLRKFNSRQDGCLPKLYQTAKSSSAYPFFYKFRFRIANRSETSPSLFFFSSFSTFCVLRSQNNVLDSHPHPQEKRTMCFKYLQLGSQIYPKCFNDNGEIYLWTHRLRYLHLSFRSCMQMLFYLIIFLPF